jgi:hypothetical protein
VMVFQDMLTRSGKSENPCLVSDFRRHDFCFSPLSMMLAIGLSYIPFIILRYIPSITSFIRAFIMKWCWIISKAFSESIEIIEWFLSLLLLMCLLHLLICICWTIPASLGWRWFGHGVGTFQYVVIIGLPLFCWGYLLLCSLRRFGL